MREKDMEWVEMNLKPLRVATDRLDEAMHSTVRQLEDYKERVRVIEQSIDAQKTDIAQGLASIRSLLQRANRAAREQGIIEDDDDSAEDPEVVDAGPLVSHTAKRSGGRFVL